jgi:hypothetical protein
MDLNDLMGKAEELVQEHGGELASVAGELEDVATGDGDVQDKAIKAVEAVKEALS